MQELVLVILTVLKVLSELDQCSAKLRQEASSGPVCSTSAVTDSPAGGALLRGFGVPLRLLHPGPGVRWDLTLQEATSIAREAVYRATHRDAWSGNCVDVFHVSSAGWKRRGREDLREEYYRERERRGGEDLRRSITERGTDGRGQDLREEYYRERERRGGRT
ncbi:Proteasome subunit beta type-5 [Dissostichus eleginoides]|uniref:Proteasome subunit beta type-5 n=1 Tax=Dissostichus eleginoides TaxID=100907 RepID=A0AAD9FFQ0_DISEL|nr:Proteasome subunit beta type-5 [Dissostichus eleginoides]